MNRRSFIFILLASLLFALPCEARRRWIPKPVAASGAWYVVSGKTCVAAYQPKNGALSTIGQSYSNLANPGTNDAAPGTAPTWDSTNGWKFDNASSQYLTTGITPANGYTMIVRFSTPSDPSSTQWMCGVDNASDARFYLSPNWAAGNRIYGSGSFDASKASTYPAGGVICVAGQKGYFNGTDEGITIGAWTTTASSTIYIGTMNNGSGAPASFYWKGYIQAMAVYSGTLTAGEVATVTTAMQAL